MAVLTLMVGTPVSAAPGTSAAGRASPIIHRPLGAVLPGQSLWLRARPREDSVARLAKLHLYYRWAPSGPFLRKSMTVDSRGVFVGCVPGTRFVTTDLHYYLEAMDVKGQRRAVHGTARRPVVVRPALGLAPSTPGRVEGCPDGPGQRASAAEPPPTRAQLRRVKLRNRTLALEARGRRLRNTGRGMVYAGLLTLAAGLGFVGYGLGEGPEFLWAGVVIAGVGALVAIIGGPIWATGAAKLRRAHRQFVKPKAFLPAERRRLQQRWWSLPGRPDDRQTVLAWRFKF